MLRNKLIALFLWLLGATPAFAQASSTSQNIQIGAQCVYGMQSMYPNTIFQYQEPASTTAQMVGATTVLVPLNTLNNQIDLAALFPGFNSPICYGVQEVTTPAQQLNIGLSNAGPRIQLAAGGFIFWRANTGSPTLYIDNTSLTENALVRVFGLSN